MNSTKIVRGGFLSGQSPKHIADVTFGIQSRRLLKSPISDSHLKFDDSPFPGVARVVIAKPRSQFAPGCRCHAASEATGTWDCSPGARHRKTACRSPRMSQAITDSGVIWMVTSSNAANTGPTLASARCGGAEILAMDLGIPFVATSHRSISVRPPAMVIPQVAAGSRAVDH